MRIEVDDVDGLCAELMARHPRHNKAEVHTMPWGTRDFTVTDPFGNRLTFTGDGPGCGAAAVPLPPPHAARDTRERATSRDARLAIRTSMKGKRTRPSAEPTIR